MGSRGGLSPASARAMSRSRSARRCRSWSSRACGSTAAPSLIEVQAAVDDYHRRAEGTAVIDYAFHLLVSDATRDVTQRELPQLIEKGYTSFKIYMTYDDLKLGDRQILEVLDKANHPVSIVTKSALVMRDIDILSRMAAANRP